MEEFLSPRLQAAHISLLLVAPLVWLLRNQPKTKGGLEIAAWYVCVFVLVGTILGALAETVGLSLSPRH